MGKVNTDSNCDLPIFHKWIHIFVFALTLLIFVQFLPILNLKLLIIETSDLLDIDRHWSIIVDNSATYLILSFLT